jgi:hypothetical protein
MLDYLGVVVSGVITGVTVLIGITVGTKLLVKQIKTEIFGAKSELKDELEKWLNSENGKMALFQIGGLLGQGIKTGVGLDKGKGKGGLEGLVLELAGRFLGNKLGAPSTTENSTPQGL